MKNSVIVFIALGGIIAGAVIYLNQTKFSAPAIDPQASKPAALAPENVSAPKTDTPAPAPPASAPTLNASATPVIADAKPDDSANPIHKLVDGLLSATNGLDKHNLFQQLVKSGQIDAAIAELQQRAAQNPNDPKIPTTLGEALLNKLRDLHDSGKGDVNDMGILAMQADQSFNNALKIDPANYEAQLVKSISQTFWPADAARDGQVVQTLTGLIDRQETMTPQSDFAQTYLYLGNEYQKIGQPDKAQATWQLGLQKFPNDPTLLKKISGQ
jgi:tetratricopeptide (TPR) repeat protein